MMRLDLPTTLSAAGYRLGDRAGLAAIAAASHVNATSPYRSSAAEYETMIASVA